MIKLTDLEKEFLNIFKNNDLDDAEYLCRVYDYTNLNEHQVPGIVSSLVKKGIIKTDYEGTEDHIVFLTEFGVETFKTTFNKEYDKNTIISDLKMLREYISSLKNNSKHFDTLMGNTSSLYSTYLFMRDDDSLEYLRINADGSQFWENLTKEEAIGLLQRSYKPQLIEKWGLNKDFKDELSLKLKNSCLTPGTYTPSANVRSQEHIAIFAEEKPLISLGFSSDKSSVKEAEDLLKSNALKQLAAKFKGAEFSIGTFHGSNHDWKATEIAVCDSEKGKVEIGNEQGDLHWIVFGVNALEIATFLCVNEEVQNIAYFEDSSIDIAKLLSSEKSLSEDL